MNVAIWATVAPFALWAVARLSGLAYGWLVVTTLAFTPYAAIGSAVPLILALATGHWWAALVAAAAFAVLAGGLVPRATGRPENGDGPVLRVLTANLYHGDADLDTVLALATDLRVDLLALQEYTPLAQKKLVAAGLSGLLPHRVTEPLWGGIGAALYSRYPLTKGHPRINPAGYLNATGTLLVPGADPVHVESAHPASPSAYHQLAHWRRGLAGQPRATPDGPLRVLLGDFNATLDHGPLRRLVASGYRDAASVVGKGLVPTWPYFEYPLPPVTLDHVLADRRIRVRAVAIHPLPNSDHRALYAELILPSAKPATGGKDRR
jgi:endonuclease/exonuclease/phosphatase (EEP) superfamily protein YafD